MSTNHYGNLSDRLIRIIENNAEELTESTVKKLQNNPRTHAYHKLSHHEMHERCYEVYHNLGLWLWEKSEEAIQARYNQLGKTRHGEEIPLSEVLWALVLMKDRLIEYLNSTGLVGSAMELYQQQELDRLIGHFFDKAVCYTAAGYEHEEPKQMALVNDRELKDARRLRATGS
jgi:hypothetical protein